MIRYIIHLWNAHRCEHVIHQSFGKHPGPHPPWTWLHELLWQDHGWPLLTTPTSIGCTIKTWLAALLWERSELNVYSSGSFPCSHWRLKISQNLSFDFPELILGSFQHVLSGATVLPIPNRPRAESNITLSTIQQSCAPCSEICATGRLFQGQQQHPWPALVLKAPGANSMIFGTLLNSIKPW